MTYSYLNDGRNALDLETVRKFAPSVFAAEKHESRSNRYAYIPTAAPLQALMNEGFVPFRAMQSRTRIEGKQAFTKHLLRLRRRQDMERAAVVGETVNEVLLTNAHDGTSAYKMTVGVFRFVCANGMVVGDSSLEIRVPHRGNEQEISGKIIDAAYEVTGHFDKVEESKEAMQSIVLREPVKLAFAEAALALKYGEKEPVIEPAQVLRARRYDDKGENLWKVFNVIQENLTRGGIRPTEPGKRRTREVTGIDESVRLNKSLWGLAEAIAKSA